MSDWLDLSNVSNLYIQSYVKGFVDISGGNLILRNNGINVEAGDISLNGRLLVQSDISSNGRLFLANDASLGGRLFVNGDVSMNGNLVIGKNITILGDLTVQEYTNSAIINTLTTNVFNISEDLSLNGRIMASSDASFGGKLNVNQAATFNSTTTATGLITANGGITIPTGQTTTINGTLSRGTYSSGEVIKSYAYSNSIGTTLTNSVISFGVSGNGSSGSFVTIFTITYTPKSNNSLIYVNFDAYSFWQTGASGADGINTQLTVRGTQVAFNALKMAEGLGTSLILRYDGLNQRIFPLNGAYKNTALTEVTINVQIAKLGVCDDTLTIGVWNLFIQEIQA